VMHQLTKIVPGEIEVLILDIIEAREGPTETAWQTRTSLEWAGHTVPVVSRAGLIALKQLRGSPQDKADIAALEGGALPTPSARCSRRRRRAICACHSSGRSSARARSRNCARVGPDR